jgi:hypothetical protein
MIEELHAKKIAGEETISLDRAFGYTAGRGHTPRMCQALDDSDAFDTCTKIWVLNQLQQSPTGKRRYSIVALCKAVAVRFATCDMRGRGQSSSRIHQIRVRCFNDKHASHLRKTYYAWKRAHASKWIPFAQQELRRRWEDQNQQIRDTNAGLDRFGTPSIVQERRDEITYVDYLLNYTAPLRQDLGLQ